MEEVGELTDAAALVTLHLAAERPWRDARELAPAVQELRARYVEVRRGLLNKRNADAEAASDRLDDELSKKTELRVEKIETHLRGREIASREQLRAVLLELEERIGPLLDRGARARIL